MKKFFLILSGVFPLVSLVIIAVNFQNDVQYWLFAFENGSPTTLLFFLFLMGFLGGIFLTLGFTAKKVDTGSDDF